MTIGDIPIQRLNIPVDWPLEDEMLDLNKLYHIYLTCGQPICGSRLMVYIILQKEFQLDLYVNKPVMVLFTIWTCT